MPMGLNFGLGLGSGQQISNEWTPALLPNINTWFDAHLLSSMTIDGSNRVSAWVDRIGGIKTYSGGDGTLTLAPTYDAAKQAVIFPTGKLMAREHSFPDGAITLVFIVKLTGTDTPLNQYLMSHNTDMIRFYFLATPTPAVNLRSSTATLSNSFSYAVMGATQRLIYFTHTTTGNSLIYGYKCDGTVESPTDVNKSGNSGTTAFGAYKLVLGANTLTGGSGLQGELKATISILGSPLKADMDILYAWAKEYYGVQ